MSILFKLLQRIAARAASIGLAEKLLLRLASLMGRAGTVTWTQVYQYIRSNPRQIYKVLVEVGNILGLAWLINEVREVLSSPNEGNDSTADQLQRWLTQIPMAASHANTGVGSGPAFVRYPVDVETEKAALERVRLVIFASGGSRQEAELHLDALKNVTASDFELYAQLQDEGIIPR